MTNPPSKLMLDNGHYIAYHKFTPSPTTNCEKRKTGVIFHGGFKSDMEGSKAIFLEKFCIKNNIPFLRFDYLGHGQSSGEFNDYTIGQWSQNSLSILDELTEGKQILVGSSLGSWLVLLSALARKERIHSILTIAAAPDFTEDLMWNKLSEEEKRTLKTKGIYQPPQEEYEINSADCEPYLITYQLIKEARKHLLLNDNINITCPIRLIHSMNDKDVPYQTSIKISELVKSPDVMVCLQKNGDHRMSTNEDLTLITQMLKQLL